MKKPRRGRPRHGFCSVALEGERSAAVAAVGAGVHHAAAAHTTGSTHAAVGTTVHRRSGITQGVLRLEAVALAVLGQLTGGPHGSIHGHDGFVAIGLTHRALDETRDAEAVWSAKVHAEHAAGEALAVIRASGRAESRIAHAFHGQRQDAEAVGKAVAAIVLEVAAHDALLRAQAGAGHRREEARAGTRRIHLRACRAHGVAHRRHLHAAVAPRMARPTVLAIDVAAAPGQTRPRGVVDLGAEDVITSVTLELVERRLKAREGLTGFTSEHAHAGFAVCRAVTDVAHAGTIVELHAGFAAVTARGSAGKRIDDRRRVQANAAGICRCTFRRAIVVFHARRADPKPIVLLAARTRRTAR